MALVVQIIRKRQVLLIRQYGQEQSQKKLPIDFLRNATKYYEEWVTTSVEA